MYTDRWRVPDALWEIAQSLIPPPPPHPLGCCRPRKDDRRVLAPIFFVLRTGCQWNALNATGLCESSVVHRRFQEWAQAGAFLSQWAECLRLYEAGSGIAWEWLAMDGAMTKAPPGGRHGPQSRRPGQGRRQAQPADGRRRRAAGLGGGRRPPQRLQDGPRHHREHPRGAPGSPPVHTTCRTGCFSRKF